MPAQRIAPSDNAGIIRRVTAYPLRVTLPKAQRTSQGDFPAVEILVVEVETESGIVGIGEGLARRGSRGYAALVDDVLTPLLLGQDARDRRKLWRAMRGALTGRPGGQLVEAISALDIAFWDIAGKLAGEPVHRLLGGMGRQSVRAYASSINWLDDATVEAEVASAVAQGFREIKVKLGKPVKDAVARAALVRRLAPDLLLGVDANWAYDVDEAMFIGRALADLGYDFFEEPIVPQDRAGYRRLSQHLPIRLAAGESDYVAAEALISLEDRSIGMIQPDVTRSGGITETWRITELAAAHHVAYAPHVGWSGAICVAASLHLAAAAETFRSFECMVYDNPLRDDLCVPRIGSAGQLVDGELAVPQAAGLGIELDRAVLDAHRIG
jgi:D-galactarolactone cycloisomerase